MAVKTKLAKALERLIETAKNRLAMEAGGGLEKLAALKQAREEAEVDILDAMDTAYLQLDRTNKKT